MKSIKFSSLLPLLVLCIALTSCESDEVAPAEAVMAQDITENASSSGANVIKIVDKVELPELAPYVFTYGCGGLVMKIIEGTLHTEYTFIENKNKYTVHYLSNFSNFRVVDETTGIEYVGKFLDKVVHHTEKPNSLPNHFTSTLSLVLTAPGKNNNILVKIDRHLKIDADGNVTPYVDNVRIECQK